MNLKKWGFFALAVGISMLAAIYRWGDSAHSIGQIAVSGGGARHAAFLTTGWDRYNLIATGTVIPPFQGDVKVVLEGKPEMDYEIFASGPVIDLKLRRLPKFRDNTLFDLHPMDRLALWVLMRPPVLDPVCGMSRRDHFIQHSHHGKTYHFCSQKCLQIFLSNPEEYRTRDFVTGKYTLGLYDVKSGKRVANYPIVFGGSEQDANKHHQ